VIVRLSDFKSNEYSNLLGGSRYEPDEENPMLAFAARRGTSHRNFTTALRSNAAR
jgi:phosphoenolpyruvate synthase/pyruvate phosphate dikinase